MWGVITVNSTILHDSGRFCHTQIQKAAEISQNAHRDWVSLKQKLEAVPVLVNQMDELKGKFGTLLKLRVLTHGSSDKLKKRIEIVEELLTEEIEIFLGDKMRINKEAKLREIELYRKEAEYV